MGPLLIGCFAQSNFSCSPILTYSWGSILTYKITKGVQVTVPQALQNIQGKMAGDAEVQAWWLVTFPREAQRSTG